MDRITSLGKLPRGTRFRVDHVDDELIVVELGQDVLDFDAPGEVDGLVAVMSTETFVVNLESTSLVVIVETETE